MNVEGPAVESRPHRKQPADLPSVSIILLLKNELATLSTSFDIIANQDYDGPVEYVYVDSGSTDGTLEFMRDRGVPAHAIEAAAFHHGRTRNLAASRAKHDILVYLSGDATPNDERWLSRLVEPFQDPEVGATYGRQIAPHGTSPLRSYAMEYEYPLERQVRALDRVEKAHLGMFRMSNANSAIRTELWRKFKFDETVIMSEDVGMCYRILTSGMKVVYVPEAAVIHCHDRSIWHEFQKAFDSAVSLKRMGILGNPELGSETHYGLQRVVREFRHWLNERKYGCAAHSLVISVVKWFGVQLGKRAHQLPGWVRRHVSAGIEKMHE